MHKSAMQTLALGIIPRYMLIYANVVLHSLQSNLLESFEGMCGFFFF